MKSKSVVTAGVSNEVADTPTADDVRVLKTATCPSLSGKSTLTYELGCNAKSEIQFRISANSGKGFFNKEWVAQSSIAKLLEKMPKGRALTCATLMQIFHHKSVNTGGFLLAALRQEGLVQHMKDKPRCYELCDPKPFIAQVNSLLGSTPEVGTGVKTKAAGSIQKAATKGRPRKPA
jgi:hypothetical protein